MKTSIDIKKFLVLTLAFILFTAIGTLSHEYGHIIVAKKLGYQTKLDEECINSVALFAKNLIRNQDTS